MTTNFSKLYFNKLVMRDLVPFVKFKKLEKRSWRSVPLLKPETLLKATLIHGCFSRFLNCTNGRTSRKSSYMFRQ